MILLYHKKQSRTRTSGGKDSPINLEIIALQIDLGRQKDNVDYIEGYVDFDKESGYNAFFYCIENVLLNDTIYATFGNNNGDEHFNDLALSRKRHTARIAFISLADYKS